MKMGTAISHNMFPHLFLISQTDSFINMCHVLQIVLVIFMSSYCFFLDKHK